MIVLLICVLQPLPLLLISQLLTVVIIDYGFKKFSELCEHTALHKVNRPQPQCPNCNKLQ